MGWAIAGAILGDAGLAGRPSFATGASGLLAGALGGILLTPIDQWAPEHIAAAVLIAVGGVLLGAAAVEWF